MRYLPLAFLFRYIVGFTPPDSSFSEYEIGFGGGQYTYADCSGEHIGKYYDGGVRVTQKFEAPFRIGVSMGSLPLNDNSSIFVYPDIAFDNNNFSFGTTGIRIGRIDKTFFELKGLDEVPFASGRGLFRIGLGIPMKESGSRFWIGANTGPYRQWGLAGGIELKSIDNHFYLINGRYGIRNQIPEFGVSLGLQIRN
jgi:hypothetical protein